MRKWKWTLFFVAVALAIIAVAREQHYAREKYEAQKQADCVELSVSPAEKHDCAKEAQDRKEYAPWWYVLFAWPEGITTWAIIVTFVFIGWQADETRKSARGAEKAADAALLNVNVFIRSERPWISVKIEQTPWGRGFNVIAMNKGRTPARILSHAENCIVMDAMEYATEFLPIPPQYGESVMELETVLPEDSTEIYEITRKSITKAGYSETDVSKLERCASVAYVFGVIVYCDVLGTSSEVTYETRWCCWLVPDSTPDGVIACLSTQDGYTGHT